VSWKNRLDIAGKMGNSGRCHAAPSTTSTSLFLPGFRDTLLGMSHWEERAWSDSRSRPVTKSLARTNQDIVNVFALLSTLNGPALTIGTISISPFKS